MTIQAINEIIASAKDRKAFWTFFINKFDIKDMAEIGVYEGDFAAQALKDCEKLEKYYMVDPWRHLSNWKKPANKSDEIFNNYYNETLSKTNFAKEKRIILRGKTTEIIDEIPNDGLDFAYIDGDHTLKGIAIDLINIYEKIKNNGWIGGDDFCNSIWQHPRNFEPTLVFPFAIYFAEAVSATIFALPYNQFLLKKTKNEKFNFINLTNKYTDTGLRKQLQENSTIIEKMLKKIKAKFVTIL